MRLLHPISSVDPASGGPIENLKQMVPICPMLGAFIAIRFPRWQWITQHIRSEALPTLSRARQVYRYAVEAREPWKVR